MTTLFRHEWRADSRWRALAWLGSPAIWGTWMLFTPQPGSPLSLLVAFAATEAFAPFVAMISAGRSVRREWRNGTVYAWLRFRWPGAARIGMKLLAAVAGSAAYALLGFALSLLAALAEVVLEGPHGRLPGFESALGNGGLLAAAFTWGTRCLAFVLAWLPPFAALGVALEALRIRWRALRRPSLAWALWALLWLALARLGAYLPPVFEVVHFGGLSALVVAPLSSVPFLVRIAPRAAVSAWPLVAAWVLAAGLYGLSLRWVQRPAAFH